MAHAPLRARVLVAVPSPRPSPMALAHAASQRARRAESRCAGARSATRALRRVASASRAARSQWARARRRSDASSMGFGARADRTRAVALCEREALARQCRDGAHVRSPSFAPKALAHAVTLSPFDIDRTEVTRRRLPRCVSAGACAPPGFSAERRALRSPRLPGDARALGRRAAYCAWPAAACPPRPSGSTRRAAPKGATFPWGNVYNPHLANHGSLAPTIRPTRPTASSASRPSGSFPDGATPLGLLDMAGNAAEWVADVLRARPAETVSSAYAPAPQVRTRRRRRRAATTSSAAARTQGGATWLRAQRASPLRCTYPRTSASVRRLPLRATAKLDAHRALLRPAPARARGRRWARFLNKRLTGDANLALRSAPSRS